MNYKKVSN